ncbi:MAG: hydrolase [Planctomycetes bacterium]|nr:hydrolase [Planctomycetota bacterium]
MRRSESVLLVVDIQERLLPAIDGHEQVLAVADRVLRAARALNVPVLCTEQYPRGLGATVEPVRSNVGPEPIIEKLAFSCCGAEGLPERLAALGRRQVILVGIEAHVCVMQTVLDLLAAGYRPYVVADAVSSRFAADRDVAFERMRQAGAVVTTAESVMFEWLEVAGTPEFKTVSRFVRER